VAYEDSPWKKIIRFIPIGLILVAMFIFYLWLGFAFLSFEMLHSSHAALQTWSHTHPVTSGLIFIGLYALIVALSIPGAIWLTLFGGFLFPQPLSTLYVVIGATTGASALFFAARTALGDSLKKRTRSKLPSKVSSKLSKIKAGLKKGQISYLLFVRLVPLFPFWLVNLGAAFAGARPWAFVWTTAVGIIPGTFVFTQAGRGLASVFESGHLSVASILNYHVWVALVALGLFALMPLVVRYTKKINSHDR